MKKQMLFYLILSFSTSSSAEQKEVSFYKCKVENKTIYSDKYKGTTVLDGAKIVMKMLWWRVN